MGADILVIEGVETIGTPAEVGAVVTRLESLLISLRPVADARAELAVLDGGLLLDAFEVWAVRQRAVVKRLASSSLGRQ